MAATSQSNLDPSLLTYRKDSTLQSLILQVVDSIISQDSRDRGAWVAVIARRISLAGLYSVHEVEREIDRMLQFGTLYESCREIRDGVFTMIYVRNGNELFGGDIR